MTNLLFKKVDYTIGKLLEDIAIGDIVRELMAKGYLEFRKEYEDRV